MRHTNYFSLLIISILFFCSFTNAFSERTIWRQTSGPYGGDAYCLTINSSNGNIFAGTLIGIYRSTDNGNSWEQVNNGFTFSEYFIINSAVCDTSAKIFVGFSSGFGSGGVYRSDDNGDNWTSVWAGWSVFTLTIDPNGYIFAGVGDLYVIYSTDNGGNWTEIKSCISSTVSSVQSLVIDESDYLYAGVQYYGDVFKSRQTVISVNVSETTLPSSIQLEQNYPNPFNPSTVIEFSLSNEAMVKLSIYNVLGQQVTILKQGLVKPGKHSLVWNASDFPSSLYFFTLDTANFKVTKKMLLMR